MQVLQITKNDELLKVPKVLELGKHFFSIEKNNVTLQYDLINQGIVVCSLKDCYKQAPLLLIDGINTFDVIEDKRADYWLAIDSPDLSMLPANGNEYLQDFEYNWIKLSGYPRHTNFDSIFTDKNSLKFPELLAKAFEIIVKSLMKLY